jgi:hypothetical protein
MALTGVVLRHSRAKIEGAAAVPTPLPKPT